MYGQVCAQVDETFGDMIDDTPVMSGPTSFVLGETGKDCTDYLDGTQLDTCPKLPGECILQSP